MINAINTIDADTSAKELGNIAIRDSDELVADMLWEVLHETKNLYTIVDPCAFTIGRIIWEPSEPALENKCFDILEKSTHENEDKLIKEKFAFTVGEIILRTTNDRIRQRAQKLVTAKLSSSDWRIRKYYKITKNRIYEVADIVVDSPHEVFLSYAKEDYEKAKRIYDILQNQGVKVWLDREDILPGKKWEDAIEEAIKTSRYFLALLSSNSLSRKGFVQKELKIALEELDKYSSEDIFIIPVRLNNCQIKNLKLQELQWIDLFQDYQEAIKKILRVIKDRKIEDE